MKRLHLPAGLDQRTVPAMLNQSVALRPDHPALIAPGMGREETSLSYRELRDLSARLAHSLKREGVGAGDRVALLLDPSHSLESHITYHASHMLGAINVPINTRFVERELDYAIGFVEPKAIVISSDFADLIGRLFGGPGGPALVVAGGPADGHPVGSTTFEDALAADPLTDFHEARETEDADWIFTSGTTGRPKAVALTHENSVACGHQARHLWGLGPNSIYQSFAPFFTSTGCHTNLLPTILSGCTYVIEPEFEARETLRRAIRHRTTSLFLISGTMQLIFDRIPRKELDALIEESDLERIAYGGQPMAAPFYAEAQRVLVEGHGLELVHLWGLTEGGTAGTLLEPGLHLEGSERAGRHGMSIGTHGFSDWIEVEIQREDGALAEPLEIGELCLRAPSVMNRYVNDPEATEEALRGDWLHTGDMGCVDADGYIYFVDRLKQMIRRGGLNISSAEVEGVIAQHPSVAEVAAVPRPNPVLEQEVKAIVVRHPGAEVSSEELTEHCRGLLADYKVPVEIEFRDELPKNAMGRVLKGELTGSGSSLSG